MTLKDYKNEIKLLMNDNIHGAFYMEAALLKIFKQASQELKHVSFRKLVSFAKDWPTVMANLLNLINGLNNLFIKPDADIDEYLDKIKKNIKASQSSIVMNAANIITRYDTIATMSNSRMVNDAIDLAASIGWRGMVLIAESRPILEGRTLARKLSRLPIQVVFGADCQIFSLLDDAGAAFVGADAVGEKHFINKIGTKAMAATLGSQKNLYILADLSKYYDDVRHLEIPEMPFTEIWTNPPKNITIRNQYFEKIIIKKNMVFINEAGLFNQADVKKYLETSELCK
ncbi:MAG: hypothetical protein J7K40_15485 [candidate division Zixibacteria bacterium]|nr:hypothetical protein [candidate division Zixibacteria bacterium]